MSKLYTEEKDPLGSGVSGFMFRASDYQARVQELEAQGLTRSEAYQKVDAELWHVIAGHIPKPDNGPKL